MYEKAVPLGNLDYIYLPAGHNVVAGKLMTVNNQGEGVYTQQDSFQCIGFALNTASKGEEVVIQLRGRLPISGAVPDKYYYQGNNGEFTDTPTQYRIGLGIAFGVILLPSQIFGGYGGGVIPPEGPCDNCYLLWLDFSESKVNSCSRITWNDFIEPSPSDSCVYWNFKRP